MKQGVCHPLRAAARPWPKATGSQGFIAITGFAVTGAFKTGLKVPVTGKARLGKKQPVLLSKCLYMGNICPQLIFSVATRPKNNKPVS
jgi:hypothetical protein